MATNAATRVDPSLPVQDPAVLAWLLDNYGRIPQAGATQPIMQRLMQTTPDPPADFNELPSRFIAPGYAPAPSGPARTGPNLQGFPQVAANYMTRGAYGNPREKGWYAKSVVTVYAPNGVPFAVHREAAPAFDGFLKELAATGYAIRPADSGGYNLRTKRGGTSLSQHAFGNAIDVNWTTNPMQRQLKTDMPENIKDMAAKWGLEWGGTWRGQKDAMHFEWTGAPVMPGVGALRSKEDVMAAQRMLAAQGLYSGDIDGETGPLTRAALANYAQSSGTMVAGDNAQPLPDYSGDPFGVADSKAGQTADPAITQLQTFLAQNGFDPGPADGVMSEQTMAALNAYNAKADPEGAAAAASALAQSGVTNPTPQQTADAFKQATVARQTQVASAPAPQPAPTPEAPQTPQMAYADAIDRFDAEAPAQQAVAEMAAGTGTDTLAGGATPPTPRLRDQAVLDQQRADMLDEMLFGAGPHRGEYARGRPEGRWTGGGAPDASAVPMPTLSPLNPAVGGPADRRPQPPIPTMRPEGRWVSGAGGAPDAGSVPTPPARGTLYAPTFPDVYGEQPQRVYADALDRFDMEDPAAMPEAAPAPRTPPRATRETWNSMGLGSRGNAETQMSLDRDWSQPLTSAPPTPPNPYDDWTREFDTPGPITMANERMGVFEGTPDPSTIAPPSNTPQVGNVNYPGPLLTQRLPQTQAAVSEPGMGLGPYGMTPPPPETGPFFDNANPGPMALADALMKDDAYTLPTAAPDFSAADPGQQLRITDPQTPPFLGGRQAGSADLVRGLTADAYANGDLVRPEPPSTVSLVGGGPRELASDIGSYNSGLWATAPTNDIISRAEGWLRSEPQASAAGIPQGDSDWSPTPTNAAMIAALDTGDPTGAAPAQTVVADALDAAATGAGQPLIGSYGVMGTTAPRIGVDIYTPPGPSGGMDIRSPEAQTLSITAPPPQAPGAPSGGGMAPVTVQAPRIGGGGGGGGIFGLGANWAGPQWTGDVSSGVGPGGGQWWSGQTNAMGGTGALSWTGSDGRTITAYDSSVNGSWPQQGYSYRIGG